jgi:hypothetical protein
MITYTVLSDCGTCGHKHRHHGRAIDCYDKFADAGVDAVIVELKTDVDLLFIEKHLSRRPMQEIAAILRGIHAQ